MPKSIASCQRVLNTLYLDTLVFVLCVLLQEFIKVSEMIKCVARFFSITYDQKTVFSVVCVQLLRKWYTAHQVVFLILNVLQLTG